MSLPTISRFLKCQDFLLLFVIDHSKLNIFGCLDKARHLRTSSREKWKIIRTFYKAKGLFKKIIFIYSVSVLL